MYINWMLEMYGGFMQTNLYFMYISFILVLRKCTDICLLRLSDFEKSIQMSFSVKVNILYYIKSNFILHLNKFFVK